MMLFVHVCVDCMCTDVLVYKCRQVHGKFTGIKKICNICYNIGYKINEIFPHFKCEKRGYLWVCMWYKCVHLPLQLR